MYKVVLAFVVGVALAAGVAVVIVKRGQKAPEQTGTQAVATAPQAQPQAAPAPSAPAEAVPAAAVPQPPPARWKPAPAGKQAKTKAESAPASAPAEVAQNVPPQPSAPAVQPAPAAPPAETPRAAPPAAPVAPPPPPKPEPKTVTIPGGTTLTVRLAQTLDSNRNKPGDTFTATLDQPLIVDGLVIAERGARVEGRIVESKQAGRVSGVSHMALELTSLRTADGQNIAIKTQTFEKEGAKSTGKDAAKVGVASAVGAAIGAIAGGGRGAAIGAGVGGAAGTGTVLATRGEAVELKVETRLTFKMTSPVTVTEKIN